MAHVTTQVRDAVKARLDAVASLSGRVHNASRLARIIQNNEFPLCCVAVGEVVTVADGSLGPGHSVLKRDLTVAVHVAARGEDEAAEEAIDALGVDIEKALTLPPPGAGRLALWRYHGAGGVEPQPAKTEDGFVIAKTMNYTCSIRTTDAEPETNIA